MTCIDISVDGHYLLAGYKHGLLALWDCSKFRLAHLMSDVAADELSAFCTVKILYNGEQNTLCVVAAEESGRMSQVNITRQLLGKYKHQTSVRMKSVNTIAVLRPQPSLQKKERKSFCETACLTAFGANELVTVIDMKSEEKRPLKVVKRPPSPIVDERSVPLVAWGHGLTPADRSHSKNLLAIGFDKALILMSVDEETQDLEVNGFYLGDAVIN